MAIRVKRISGMGSDGQGTVEFYAACDHCGNQIDSDNPGNCEFASNDGEYVYLIHKECTNAFQHGKQKLQWSEIVDVKILTR